MQRALLTFHKSVTFTWDENFKSLLADTEDNQASCASQSDLFIPRLPLLSLQTALGPGHKLLHHHPITKLEALKSF